MTAPELWYSLPVLCGERVRLEPLTYEHAAGYLAAFFMVGILLMVLASVVMCVGLLTAVRLGRAMGDSGPKPARVPVGTVRRSQP